MMKKINKSIFVAQGISRIIYGLGLIFVLALLSGCFAKVNKLVTNYYVLDYQNSGEIGEYKRTTNDGKILEVLDTQLVKTYDRNQLVVKENFYKIRYLQNDVWATRLRDAIPNLVVQRIKAYNIFGQVSRGEIIDKIPSYYLETNVLNIEKIEGVEPKAYLRMEFVLRDSTTQKILFTHKNERYKDLIDPSMVYLVQSYNEMIMEETNVFVAKCLLYFSGKPIYEVKPQTKLSHLENYYYEQMAISAAQVSYGELSVKTKYPTEEQIKFMIVGLDSLGSVISNEEWEMNKDKTLEVGRYKVIIGNDESDEFVIPVEIKSRQRSVVNQVWSELKVVIMDESKTRVRMGYDLWVKDTNELGYKAYSGGMFSMGDDEIGSEDKLWIVPPGYYLVKLGGGSWSDLRNFATVSLDKGDRKTLTMIVDPNELNNFLVGAGVFADDDIGYGSKRIHKGALHGNISLSSNNRVDKNKPSTSVSLAGQFDNSIDIHQQITPFHFTMRSLYDLGLNISSSRDMSINLDDYSLKNVLLFYPFEKRPFLKNFAFYGRANQNTHFFDEKIYFEPNKNYVLKDYDDNIIEYQLDKPELIAKTAFYPLRMKEGMGITYRITFGSNTWISLRGGYGWQQDYNKKSYTYQGTTNTDGIDYDVYKEDADRLSKGLESTVILSAINMLKFLSINSTLDVLFPMGNIEQSYRLENENRLNIRLFRNISVDLKATIQYDKEEKPWVVFDYSSFLRLSLFY